MTRHTAKNYTPGYYDYPRQIAVAILYLIVTAALL